MDKYDLVLDLVEHPDKYSPVEIEELLSDPELKEIYTLLCKTGASLKINEEHSGPDVDEEWQKVCAQNRASRFRFSIFGNRAASLVIISLTSLAALAIGVAIAVMHPNKNEPSVVSNVDIKNEESKVNGNDTFTIVDEILPTEPVLYKDETLGVILDVVAKSYGVSVKFCTEDTSNLHLYFRFNPELPLTEVVDQLNTFEQINIRVEDKTLIVD
ncbi:MAG: hypothetical protein K2H01_11895 [Ruminococcus sp.]|nr:hypothetical protein [Ruminococcus sp.]